MEIPTSEGRSAGTCNYGDISRPSWTGSYLPHSAAVNIMNIYKKLGRLLWVKKLC